MIHVFLGLITERRGRHGRPGAGACGGASPRSCCAPACAPTATPAGGCSPRCAPCRATSCSRRRPSDLLRLAQLVVDRSERRTVGVFARIHLNRDFVSVLVYFPADRFGPETRRRVREVIARYWPGEVIGRDDRIVEMDLARMQLLIAVRPGTQPPSPNRADGRGRGRARSPAAGATTCADLLDARGRRGRRRSACCASTRDALPEAYKEDFDAVDRGRATSPGWSSCRTTTAWPSRSTPRPTTSRPTGG